MKRLVYIQPSLHLRDVNYEYQQFSEYHVEKPWIMALFVYAVCSPRSHRVLSPGTFGSTETRLGAARVPVTSHMIFPL